jgi:hypothetical protein
MKPPPGSEPYETLPYWIHAAGGWGVFVIGAIYWVAWARIAPLIADEIYKSGWETGVFKQVQRRE